jgi:hypothetical protein
MNNNNKTPQIKKKPLPNFAFLAAKKFINEEGGKYKNINGMINKKKFYKNEIDIWTNEVYNKLCRNREFGQNWMYEIPCCSFNKLYKIVISGKIPENLKEISLNVEEINLFDQCLNNITNITKIYNIKLLTNESNWIFHRNLFFEEVNETTLIINDIKYFKLNQITILTQNDNNNNSQNNKEEFSIEFIKLHNNLLNINLKIDIFEGINWNTITIKFI